MKNTNDTNNINSTTNLSDLIPELHNIIANNINNFLNMNNMTKKSLAESIGIAESTLNDYCNLRDSKKQTALPTIGFLVAMKNKYGIDLEDFVTKTINIDDYNKTYTPSKADKDLEAKYHKYIGSYILYYLDTSSYKGRDNNDAKDSLTFGVMNIFENKSSVTKSTYVCFAIMGISSRKEATYIKEKTDSLNSITAIMEYVSSKEFEEKLYTGDFTIDGDFAYISLEHGNTDKALAILHNTNTNKSRYIGGLGTINSVSKGREKMPTIQFIGLSRNVLKQSDEEIHRNLLLAYPTLNADSYAKELVKTFNNLYVEKGGIESTLSDYQKHITIRANLEHYIKDSLEKNAFRYGKIANQDDDAFYHLLKNESEHEIKTTLK